MKSVWWNKWRKSINWINLKIVLINHPLVLLLFNNLLYKLSFRVVFISIFMHIYVEIFISREVILTGKKWVNWTIFSDERNRRLDGKRWRLPLETITGGLFQVLTEIILGFGEKKCKTEGDIYYYRHFLHRSYEDIIPGS